MAWVDLTYKNSAIEENPAIITWIQLYLIFCLDEESSKESWISGFKEEMIINANIDAYKYIFDETLLDTRQKENWAIDFISKCSYKLDQMNIVTFSNYIKDDVLNEDNFDRIKKLLKTYKQMLEGKLVGF